MSTTRDTDDEPTVQRPNDNEALQVARERAREVRRQFVREWNKDGHVSDRSKIRAGEVAVDYRDVLIDYKPQVATPPWDERELDWIMDYVGRHTTVKVDSPGVGRGTVEQSKPAITQIDARKLYELTKRLDQIWRELGFGADVDESNHLYQIPDGSETADREPERKPKPEPERQR
jgi:hypothetical protein